MSLTDSLISGGTSVFGDILGAWGQAQTNAQNYKMFKENLAWQEKMSNTAMQRRFEDYKAAGVNPLLVTSSQGASSPSISTPENQNPMASFGQLGSQAGTALMLKAQIDNVKADTKVKETTAETNARNLPPDSSVEVDTGEVDADGNPITQKGYGGGGMAGTLKFKKDLADLDSTKAQINLIQANTKLMGAQADETEVRKSLEALDTQQKKDLFQSIYKRAAAEASSATSGASVAATEAKVMGGRWGPVLRYLQIGTGIASQGAGVFK